MQGDPYASDSGIDAIRPEVTGAPQPLAQHDAIAIGGLERSEPEPITASNASGADQSSDTPAPIQILGQEQSSCPSQDSSSPEHPGVELSALRARTGELQAQAATWQELRQALAESQDAERTLREQLTRVEARRAKEREGRAAAEETLASAQLELRAMRRDQRKVRSELDLASKDLLNSERGRERLRAKVRALQGELQARPDLLLRDGPFLTWLMAEAGPACIGMNGRDRMGYTGTGPYERELFNAVLERVGIVLHPMPDPRVSHIVVGRADWSEDHLDLQVDQRRGSTLRVYSQEMLLAALITGRDPLDEGGEDVLNGFKTANGALQYLAAEGLLWPTVHVPKAFAGEVDWTSVDESPLHAKGYSVGVSSPLTQAERRNVLRAGFEDEQLPWVHSDEYMASWGRPGMPKRLWRMANHLAALIWFQGRGPGMATARAHWVADLAWLHEAIYRKRKFKFLWPKVSVGR